MTWVPTRLELKWVGWVGGERRGEGGEGRGGLEPRLLGWERWSLSRAGALLGENDGILTISGGGQRLG